MPDRKDSTPLALRLVAHERFEWRRGMSSDGRLVWDVVDGLPYEAIVHDCGYPEPHNAYAGAELLGEPIGPRDLVDLGLGDDSTAGVLLGMLQEATGRFWVRTGYGDQPYKISGYAPLSKHYGATLGEAAARALLAVWEAGDAGS